MRFVLVAAIASAVSSSNGFAEDKDDEGFVIVPEEEDVIAYDEEVEGDDQVDAEIISNEHVTESDEVMAVINQLVSELENRGGSFEQVPVLTDDVDEESMSSFVQGTEEDALIEMGDGQKLTIKALVEFAQKPSTQQALKEMFAGFKKSVIGMMTPETLENIPHLLDALPLIFVAAIVASDPNLQAHLFQSGLPHYFLYDAIKNTLSNGGLIPKMSHSIDEGRKRYLIGIMSVIASFMALGAPSQSMRGNLHFAQLFTGLFDALKWWVSQKLQDIKQQRKAF